MIKVGLTGGFGSGKNKIVQLFKQLDIDFFDVREKVKEVILNNNDIKEYYYMILDKSIPQNIPKNSIIERRDFLDQFLLPTSTLNLEKAFHFNSDINLELIKEFNKFCESSKSKYCLYVSSSIFDFELEKNFNYTIQISCPIEKRLKRHSDRMINEYGEINYQVLKNEEIIMKSQFEDKLKEVLANFVIDNSGVTPLWPQVLKIDKSIV